MKCFEGCGQDRLVEHPSYYVCGACGMTYDKRDRCRSCLAKIVWGVTNSGRRMPVDAEPVENGNIRLKFRDGLPALIRYYNADEKAALIKEHGNRVCWFVSHFATCPDAPSHRKKS